MVLDDSSKMILAGGEFDSATTELSIQLLQEAYDKDAHISPIREIITDHGAQFYANTRGRIMKNCDEMFQRVLKLEG